MPLDAAQPRMTSVRSPLRVRNKEANTTVFTKTVNGDSLRLIFGPAGTHNDTQRVPLALAEDIDFLNSLEQGVLEIVSGPEDVMESLKFETEQVRAERAEAQERTVGTLDRRQDRDIVGVTCIGPAPKGRDGLCKTPLIQQASQRNEQPPLCPVHLHLAPTFYLAEAGSKGGEQDGATQNSAGIVRREWKQATTGPVLPTQQ